MVVVAASSWGCWSLVLRPAGLPALASVPVIMAAQGLGLLPFVRGERMSGPWTRGTLGLLGLHAVFDAVNALTFFAAMAVTTIGVAVLTHYLAPVIVALLAPVFDRQRVLGAPVAGLVSMAGLALVLQPWRAPAAGAVLGAVLGTTSAFAYAGCVLVARRLVGRIGTARTISYHTLLSVALLLPFAAWHDILGMPLRTATVLVLAAATLGAGGAWLFLRGLATIGSTKAAMLTYCEPLVACVVGMLAWKESLGPTAIAGAALVLLAGLAVTRAEAEPLPA
jgi:drug/metabolite transporter (DMT)-like permease